VKFHGIALTAIAVGMAVEWLFFTSVAFAIDGKEAPVLTGSVGPDGLMAGVSAPVKLQQDTKSQVRLVTYIPQAPAPLNPACTAIGDAWYYDLPDGGPNCGGSPSPQGGSQQASLADIAKSVESRVPGQASTWI
jgi:hypothetical protein